MDQPNSGLPQLAINAGAHSARRRLLISLTPLIDVVFILLIFFMLASSFLDLRTIDLVAPVRTASGASMEGALLVDVRADDLRLSGETVSLDTLVARIEDHLARTPGQRVLIRPASGVTLQAAVQILDRLTVAGARDIALIRHVDR